MKTRVLTLASLLCLAFSALSAKPPKGFTTLFNGKDLKGWWGLKTEDPAKWMALSPEKFAEKKAASLKDIAKHWSVDGEELVNDGHGMYLTTEKNYGDFELLVDYKTVAKADSGIYLRGIPQVQIWDYTKEGGKWNIGADKGSGGLWNNSKGAALPTDSQESAQAQKAQASFGSFRAWPFPQNAPTREVRAGAEPVEPRSSPSVYAYAHLS